MENTLEKMAIESLIYEIRGQKVMLDRDLAKLYGVETKVLNQAVKTLVQLAEEDRLVGIISHVSELKEKIEKQILVTKGGAGGSFITIKS